MRNKNVRRLEAMFSSGHDQSQAEVRELLKDFTPVDMVDLADKIARMKNSDSQWVVVIGLLAQSGILQMAHDKIVARLEGNEAG